MVDENFLIAPRPISSSTLPRKLDDRMTGLETEKLKLQLALNTLDQQIRIKILARDEIEKKLRLLDFTSS